MIFNDHHNLSKLHAFLSPSNASWVGYSEEKLLDAWEKAQAKVKGTQLHAVAKKLIDLGVRLPNTKAALNMFVNDAIGYRMVTEQTLAYSLNAFGTADAISFRDGILRIHDLKTGTSRVKMTQLEVYAALFCLEYDVIPSRIDIELRIYQSSSIVRHIPDSTAIKQLMEKITFFDSILENLKTNDFLWPLSMVDDSAYDEGEI